jgi:hypothetical protein
MHPRDRQLRNELLTVIVIKIGLLALLWLLFVHGARLFVDGGIMAGQAIPEHAISVRGGSNAR